MAKKKKGKPDARGYQTSSPATAASALAEGASSSSKNKNASVRFTATAHRELQGLIDPSTFPLTLISSTQQGVVSSGRLRKRIGTIYDTLMQIGISFEQIEESVRVLGCGVTLESALDWLCLNLPTTQLPAILAEGAVRDDELAITKQLQVLVAPPGACTKDDVSSRILTEDTTPTQSIAKTESIDTAKVDQEEKRRILEQYQFEFDEIEQDFQGPTGDTSAESQGELCGKPLTESQVVTIDSPSHLEETPQQAQLSQARQRLQQLIAEDNEADNYFRSKVEIKQMQSRRKQLRKTIEGLEKTVQRQQQDKQLKEVMEQEGKMNEQDEEAAVGLENFDRLFDETHQNDVNEERQQPDPIAHDSLVEPQSYEIIIQIPPIPKSWTGKTPIELLREACRKLGMKPVFTKLGSMGGAAVSLRPIKPTSGAAAKEAAVVEQTGLDASYEDAQHYVATVALYQINKSLPIYRLLPPFYRDLWRSWLDEEKDQKQAVVQSFNEDRDAAIQKLIDLLPPSIVATPTEPPSTHEDVDVTEPALKHDQVDWELAEDEDASVIKAARPEFDERISNDVERRRLSVNYQSMLQDRSQLPIYSRRMEILETIHRNSVTVISAETGAGKSTQCPQFLLEEALAAGNRKSSILCTQPRRIAATSLAERVSEEMCEPYVGNLVGYSIRMQSAKGPKTRLEFCTTGVLLRRMVEDPSLTGVTHVVVDEVHERQWQIDVLLVNLRQILQTSRKDLKIILMSATLDAHLFCNYFNGAPLVTVPGRMFPVASYYLEDLMEATGHIIELGSACSLREASDEEAVFVWTTTTGGEKRKETIWFPESGEGEFPDDFEGYSLTTRRSMERVDETVINYDLIEDVLNLLLIASPDHDLTHPEGSDLKGAVLIFLPGIGEIRTLAERLQASRAFGNSRLFDIVPLHSSLSSKDQQRAFRVPPGGLPRKIIISTNVAETSLTIPDVVIVIDSGRLREIKNDRRTSTQKLVPSWCSRASAKQRSGRAGRVQPGLCLKLFSSRTEKLIMKERAEPELKRMPLEEVCLTILGTCPAVSTKSFLEQTPEPPPQDAIQNALQNLNDIGAVALEDSSAQSGQNLNSRETLSTLGKHLCRLPVDVRIGKVLIYGALFQCIGPIATIAACLSTSQSIFNVGLLSSAAAKSMHATFRVNESDFLTMQNAFDSFQEAERSGKAYKFCRDYFLNIVTLREIRDARLHFLELLCGLGFLEREQVGFVDKHYRTLDELVLSNSAYNVHAKNVSLIHSVILAGLYPNVARLTINNSKLELVHRNTEKLFIHSSSVNYKQQALPSSSQRWLVFHEKFGTSEHRVTVSVTCFVPSIAVMFFSKDMEVRHLDRMVIVDGWIELSMAAQTGVMIRALRKRLDSLLKNALDQPLCSSELLSKERLATIGGISRLVESTEG